MTLEEITKGMDCCSNDRIEACQRCPYKNIVGCAKLLKEDVLENKRRAAEQFRKQRKLKEDTRQWVCQLICCITALIISIIAILRG